MEHDKEIVLDLERRFQVPGTVINRSSCPHGDLVAQSNAAISYSKFLKCSTSKECLDFLKFSCDLCFDFQSCKF